MCEGGMNAESWFSRLLFGVVQTGTCSHVSPFPHFFLLPVSHACHLRSTVLQTITVYGWMKFDINGIESLELLGLFEGIVLHEMGHVLGIG